MVVVKFFGLLSIDIGVKELWVNEGTVWQVLQETKERCPQITDAQFKQAIIFINKKQCSGKERFSVRLKDGDEVALLSPASGG